MSALLDSLAGPARRAACAQHARYVLATIASRVASIPCRIEVTHFLRVRGSGCRWTADSADDYYGYTEADFDVRDSRGRSAPWLEKKLTPGDRARIESEIAQHMENA